MNIYRYRFTCLCPSDGDTIAYDLEIRSRSIIMAEDIIKACTLTEPAYHENLADDLAGLGGEQTLEAAHQGVAIKTIRGSL